MGRGRARVTRGLVMSAACLFLPSVAHVAAGGALPTHAGFLLAAALLSAGCVGLADRRRSPAEIGALLLASQPLLHVLLVLAGHHGPGAIVPGAVMLLAHLVAAGVLTVVLSGAEAVAWSLASLSETVLLTRVRRLLATPGQPWRAHTPHAPRRSPAPRAVELVTATPWRGPPVPARI